MEESSVIRSIAIKSKKQCCFKCYKYIKKFAILYN